MTSTIANLTATFNRSKDDLYRSTITLQENDLVKVQNLIRQANLNPKDIPIIIHNDDSIPVAICSVEARKGCLYISDFIGKTIEQDARAQSRSFRGELAELYDKGGTRSSPHLNRGESPPFTEDVLQSSPSLSTRIQFFIFHELGHLHFGHTIKKNRKILSVFKLGYYIATLTIMCALFQKKIKFQRSSLGYLLAIHCFSSLMTKWTGWLAKKIVIPFFIVRREERQADGFAGKISPELAKEGIKAFWALQKMSDASACRSRVQYRLLGQLSFPSYIYKLISTYDFEHPSPKERTTRMNTLLAEHWKDSV